MTHSNDPLAPRSQPGHQIPPESESSQFGEPISIQAFPPTPLASATKPAASNPGRPRFTPERLAAEVRRLDQILVLATLALAFFLGSFAARNTDLWMHLATGRMIAHGQYHFGSDPFAYTSTDNYWVNHSWLFDLFGYWLSHAAGGIETSPGGAVLVIAKAFLVMILAGVMLSIRKPGQSLWIPSVLVGLGLLVLSPRLLLQPTCISFLFLGLTLYFLHRFRISSARQPLVSEKNAAAPSRPYANLFALVPLFVLWVNLDSWFFLGPLIVILYWGGEAFQQVTSPVRTGDDAITPKDFQMLGLVCILGLLACLINPHHIYAFALPPEIWAWFSAGGLKQDAWFRVYLVSPWSREYFSALSLTKGGLAIAYYLLVVTGIISFELNRANWRWWRAFIWLTFFLLSAFLARTIPFFAVVAAPITALNFQDYAALRNLEGSRPLWSILGRIGTITGLIALLALAWPGWLQGGAEEFQRTRRVAWNVEIDPSFKNAAQALRALRQQGVLVPESHGFNFIPDIADYLAWFCPDEKGFFDHRIQLFPQAGPAFAQVRQALNPLGSETGVDPVAWQKVFRDDHYRIDHLIVSSSPQDNLSVLQRVIIQNLWADPEQWSLLYLDGRTAIFGWNDRLKPGREKSFRQHEINLDQLAFGPALKKEQRSPDSAPEYPQSRSLWDQYLTGPSPRPLAVDEAQAYLDHYGQLRGKWTLYFTATQWVSAWADPIASTVMGGTIGHAAFISAELPRLHSFHNGDAIARAMLAKGKEAGSPAPLILALRAARRAVFTSPQNVNSYLILAQVYQSIWHELEEPWAANRVPLLEKLRFTQRASALQNALVLEPELPVIHLELAKLYQEMKTGSNPPATFIDFEIDHLNKFLDYTRAIGPRKGEPNAEFQKQIGGIEAYIKKREKDTDIQRKRNDYELTAATKPPLVQAMRALERGLVKQALDVLLESEPTQLGPQGRELEIQLLIQTGQGAKIEQFEILLDDAYSAQLALSSGDYMKASSFVQQMLKNMKVNSTLGLAVLLRNQNLRGGLSPDAFMEINRVVASVRDWAEWHMIEAIAALEAGDNVTSANRFKKSLELSFPTTEVLSSISPMASFTPLETGTAFASGQHAKLRQDFQFSTKVVASNYLGYLKAAGCRN